MRTLIYITYMLALFTIKSCYSQDLKIKKIQRNGSTNLYLCFEKGKDVELTGVEYYQLVIIDTTTDPVIETPVINQEPIIIVDESTKCITFGNSELQNYAGKIGTYFILTGRDAGNQEVVFGTAQLDMPIFPENVDETLTGCIVGSEEEISLRINDHTKPTPDAWTVTYGDGTTQLECVYPTDELKDSTKVPCFVIGGLDEVVGQPLLMCVDVLNQLTEEKVVEKVTVCGKEFTPEPLTVVKGPSLTVATLDYFVPELVLNADPQNGANTMDVVLYDGSEHKIYFKQSSSTTLDIKTHTPDLKKYKVLLVGLDEAVVKESILTYFQDFKVAAQELGTGSKIMEVQWKKTEDIAKYSLIISTLTSDVILYFTETTVNCPGDVGTYCYGYFVELSSGNYDVTFTPYMGEDENPHNSILYKPIAISRGSKTQEKEIMIKQTNIVWNIQNEPVVELCFDYTDDFKLVANAYDVILINNKGQWRRTKRFFQAEKGIYCSEGITLPSEQFNQNSVLTGVVIKRHENGFDVIESGYVVFELS